MSKRIIAAVLTLVMLLGMFPAAAFATETPVETVTVVETPVEAEIQENAVEPAEEATEESIPEETVSPEPVEVTRAQWLQKLVQTFEYTIEGEIVPDNYFPDLSSDAEYYNDVLIAVYYGLVDVLPNSNLRPDEAATREFAAYTLNTCMGYMAEAADGYSFSESADVTYPDDIQVAIERGWFALSDGAFLPDQAITLAEQEVMLADAESYLANLFIDMSHESQYTFKEGIIVIEDEAQIFPEENGTVIIIENLTQELAVGDRFVVYHGGLAIPYEAADVTVANGQTLITATDLYFEDAIETMDVQMEADTDPANFFAAEDAELIFIEESTGEELSQQQVIDKMASGSQSIYIPKYSKKLEIGNGISLSVQAELKNAKVCYNADIQKATASAAVWMDTDVEVTYKLSCELTKISGDGIEIYLGGYDIPGVGGLKISLKIDVTGSVSMIKKYHLKIGLGVSFNAVTWKASVNKIYDLTDRGSSINAEITAKIYLEANFGLYGKALPLRGYLYGEAGFKATVKYTTYSDIEGVCTHFAAYLYAEYGAKVEWGFLGFENTIDWNKEWIKEENSPVKISVHYEDGIQCPYCTREHLHGTTTGDPSKIAESGYSTGYDSSYFGSGLSSGGSSKGYGTGGEPIIIYTYSLDEDNNATITSYSGNATSLTIPLMLDGYNVVAIGDNAFKNQTGLRTIIMQDNILTIGGSAFYGCTNLRNLTLSEKVTYIGTSAFENCRSLTTVDIPDSVTVIGSWAFSGCTALQEVKLSKNLTTLYTYSFQNCDALTSIEIPKSLTVSERVLNGGYQYGAFTGCDNLKNVTFEEGTTEVAYALFANCTGLETIVLPDTVMVVEDLAFQNCRNLSEVTFSNNLTTIGSNAFANCSELTAVSIPDSVNVIGSWAFSGCTALQEVKLSKNLTTLYTYSFQNCDALTSIEIPKSLTVSERVLNGGYQYGAFTGCDNLKNVTFEEGTTEIAYALFANCTGLETIVLPDTVTVVEDLAFQNCRNLSEVTFSNNLTTIGSNAFQNCDELIAATIPDSVTVIGSWAFSGCTALQEVKLSKNLTTLYTYSFQNCDALTSIEIPKSLTISERVLNGGYQYGAFTGCDNLKNVTFEEGTTEIAYALFANCTGLETIVLPDTVTVVEDLAFQNCRNLSEVTLSNNLITICSNAFENCSELTAVSIPDSVTVIGSWAFSGCMALQEVTLSKNLTTLYTYSFQNCDALTSIEIPKSLTACERVLNGGYQYGAFTGCDNLKEASFEAGTSAIPAYLFTNCSGLQSITIPDTVHTVGYMAFNNCDALVEIVIPESVTTIGNNVFSNSAALTTVTWPSSLTVIPEYTFSGCTALTTVNLPDNLKTINKYAFNNCDALVTFTMPDSVTTMAENVFADCDALTEIHLSENLAKLNNNTFYNCDALTSITIPYGVTYVGNSCFQDCDALVSVDMANSVTSMGTNVFYHCDLLKDVKLSRNLTAIPSAAFKECAELEEIVIPYFTTSIAANAFNSSPKLKKVVVHEKLATITSTAFSYPTVTIFYGPTGSAAETWCTDNGYTFNENTTAATTVTVAEKTMSIPKGSTWVLDFDIDPADFAGTIILKSGNTAVATVDETGKITAVAPGTATIKILVGKASASCKVTVTQAVTQITLDQTTLALDVPNTYQLTATIAPTDATNQALTWTSSNEAAATVDENGLVTAVGNGTAVITATAADGSGVSASCTVTVTDPTNIPVSSITLDQTSVELEALGTVQLSAAVSPEDAANKNLVWSSSDESVATVDKNGLVTAHAKGTATITAAATDESGVTATCTVTVTNTAYLVTDVSGLESSHDYPDSCTDFWIYTAEGADSLLVTFDEQTLIEDGFDYLHIYDGEGNLIGTYTGTELAGQTIEIPGDTVKIQLESDDSGTEWGFRVTEVKAQKQVETIASGWSGATQWTLTDDGVLTVYGEGSMKNYGYNGGQPWLNKGVDIISVVIEEGVTSVGSGAFRNLTTLESVTFPATTLTKMGEAAFYGSGLKSVEIPASLWTIQPYTFKNCANLTSVKFNEGNLQKISDGAFYGTAITELVLPDCLGILDVYAFKGCDKLTNITIGSGLTELREAVFYGTAIPTIEIPEGITKIGPYAFKNCVALETVDMPSTLASVGEASFYACTALKTVELPDAVTTIGNYAFRKCAAIETLVLSADLVTVGECAFYGCTGLTELVIPDQVTTIKPYAFKTCTGLTSVTLGSSVETIGEGAFNTCTGLKTIVFPASLKEIGAYCFSGSYNLWQMTFEGDAPSIGDGAFKGLAATAYYPGDNATWTAENMLNYGGKITWKAQ